MSSIRLDEATRQDAMLDEPGAWVEVKPPISDRPMPSATGVVLEIGKLRERFGRRPDSVAIFPDEDDYGSGDAELTDEIARSVEEGWDS